MTNSFDLEIIRRLRDLGRGSWMLDYGAFTVGDCNLLKGGVFVTLLWYFWFRAGSQGRRDRALVAAIFVASFVVIGANQAARMLAPTRLRPYVDMGAGISFPFDMGLKHSSSFSSDHAALFFGLSTGLFFLSRSLGVAGFIYTFLVICIPRVYLGLHYPTDILSGAAVGILVMLVFLRTRLRDWSGNFLAEMAEDHPGWFYAFAFIMSYQLATLFDDVRNLGTMVKTMFGG